MNQEKPKKEKRICDDCDNMLIGVYQNYPNLEDREVWQCIWGKMLSSYGFYKCTHFKAKPKSLKEENKKSRKAIIRKGETITPTLCESCNSMTKTISTRTKSYCGKCKKPKEN